MEWGLLVPRGRPYIMRHARVPQESQKAESEEQINQRIAF